MTHNTVQTVFVIIAAAALFLQFIVLLALAGAVMPLLKQVRQLLASTQDPMRQILSDLAHVTRTLRRQATSVDAFVSETLHKGREQIHQMEALLEDLRGQADSTAREVKRAVSMPFRQVFAVRKGVSTGLRALVSGLGFGNQPARLGAPSPEAEKNLYG